MSTTDRVKIGWCDAQFTKAHFYGLERRFPTEHLLKVDNRIADHVLKQMIFGLSVTQEGLPCPPIGSLEPNGHPPQT